MAEANHILRSELAVVNEKKLVAATLSSATVTVLSSIIGLGLTANEVSKNKDDDYSTSSITLIATTLLSTLSSVMTAISCCVDYSNCV